MFLGRFFKKSGTGTRDQVFLQSFGTPPPTIDPHKVVNPYPSVAIAQAAQGVPNYYIPLNPEIWKSYVAYPTNQGQRAAIAQRQSMMFDPRNSPSRSQFVENYTDPIQTFVAGNTWETPSGLSSKGERMRQPSTRAVSPFASVPIPTRMPWDL